MPALMLLEVKLHFVLDVFVFTIAQERQWGLI